MEQYCKELYCLLQFDLAGCNNRKLSCIQEAECCYRAAVKRWMELSQKLKNYRFASEECEIQFFKDVKPKFTSVIEYYCFVYSSLLFQPEGTTFLIHFWQNEYKRLERFKIAHPDFLLCYKDEQNIMKPYFFLRKHFRPVDSTDVLIYGADPLLSANGDWLAATFLALENYNNYVVEKLKSL